MRRFGEQSGARVGARNKRQTGYIKGKEKIECSYEPVVGFA